MKVLPERHSPLLGDRRGEQLDSLLNAGLGRAANLRGLGALALVRCELLAVDVVADGAEDDRGARQALE